MNFPNVYTHRKVAEGSAKGCEICFKPTTSVLITPENKDRGFATPIVDKAAEEAKKKKAAEEKEAKIKEEMDRVKKEYEEKQKKKKDKKDKKDDEKDKDKDEKDKDKKDKKDDEKEKDKDSKDDKDKDEDKTPESDEPRVFALNKHIYIERIEKKRQAEIAKRNRERIANPGFFPSVPKGLP